MDFQINVDDKSLNAVIKSINSSIDTSLKKTLRTISQGLTLSIKNDKLLGQVLNKRSGKLRNSITYNISQNNNSLISTISSDVKYAPVHEYGFKGIVNVKQHVRQINQAFGKAIQGKTVTVGAHLRSANFPERSFMRSTLKENEEKIVLELSNEIAKEINKGLGS